MRILAGLLLCGVLFAPTRAARAQVGPTLLAVAEGALLLDALTTFDIKNHPIRNYDYYGTQLTGPGASESNPILGRHPSDAKVLAYFAVVMGGTAVGYHLLPDDYRPIAMSAIILLEGYCIHRNLKNGLTFTLPF